MSRLKCCSKCGQEKPTTEYYKRSAAAGGGLDAFCKQCKQTAYKREYRWSKLRERYGITQEEYNDMLSSQSGDCAICKEPPKRGVLHVDHCHTTGAVRGLLCPECNKALGLLKDSPGLLNNAIQYLKGVHNERPVEE